MEINNYQLTNESTSVSTSSTQNSEKFQEALEYFNELHQKSQISGVSTYLYNEALEALGLQKGDDLKGIALLKEYGYDTGAPSIDAILEYGDTDKSVGNHSYMRHTDVENSVTNTIISSTDEAEKIEPKTAIEEEIEELDEKLIVDLDDAKNYFDVAQKLSNIIDEGERRLTIDKLSGLDKYANKSFSKTVTSPLESLLQQDENKI